MPYHLSNQINYQSDIERYIFVTDNIVFESCKGKMSFIGLTGLFSGEAIS